MFSLAASALLLASSASTVFAQEGSSASSVAALVAQLRQAPTEVDQFRLIADEDRLFSFVAPNTTVGVTNGAGGRTVAATSANFPAVVGQGVSMTIGFLGPCGMNSPHTHPRATEINFSVNATLRGGVLVENGARFAEVDIAPGTATVFPQGAIHFEMNPTCEEALFVAAFNGEDPGVNQVAQRFFGLPPDIVGAALGGLGVQQVADLEALIPDNVILGVDECLQRCGIQRVAQPTAQRQPRVAANAFPNGTVGTNPFGLPAEGGAASSSTDNSTAVPSSAAPTASASPAASVAASSSAAPTVAPSSAASTDAPSSAAPVAASSSTAPVIASSSAASTVAPSPAASSIPTDSAAGAGDAFPSEGAPGAGAATPSAGASGESAPSTGEGAPAASEGAPGEGSAGTGNGQAAYGEGEGEGVTVIVEVPYPEVTQFALRR